MGRLPAAVLAPVLLQQGRGVRRRTPVLPEAAGERTGTVGGGPDPLGLLVVGESTAAGVGVAHQDDGLPHRLARALHERHRRPVRWSVSARTGATARVTAAELVPAASGAPVDLAVVVLGVNDTLRLSSRRAWREAVGRVLDGLAPRLATGGVVLLAGVPDLGRFPALPQPLRAVLGRQSRGLDRELARLAGRRPRVQHAPAPALTGPELFAADAFHPNAEAYDRWARHLADAARLSR